MAVLDKIRSKGVVVAIAVGFALFAFIVGDFLNSSSSFFNKAKENVGEIAGQDINIKDYQAAIDRMTDAYKIQSGRTDLNEELNAQIRNSVWENMVSEKLLTTEAEKVGIAVSKEELSDQLIGKNINPMVAQQPMFAGPDGRFNRAQLMQFLSALEQKTDNPQMQDQLKMAKNYWKVIEDMVKINILQQKYMIFLSKAVAANSLDAKMSFADRKTTVDVSYVMQPYFAIPDNKVTVSESEISDRYNQKKELFKQDANCAIKYVSFQVKPQKDDYTEAQNWMNKYSNEFKTTADVVALVNSQSDVRYDGTAYSAKTVPAALASFAFSGKVGDVVGPIFANDTYTMARIMQTGISQSDSVKLRHIALLEKDAAKADSLIAVIRGGGDFGELAKKYSAVQQTADKGGEIGWITENAKGTDKEFIGNAFGKGVNDVFTQKNAQGIQIFQIMAKTAPHSKVKLAILERKVKATNKTVSKLYSDAKQFAADLKAADFDKKAQTKGYVVRTAADLMSGSDRINEIAQSRQIIRWAFNSKKDDVSDVFDCGTEYVVALTTEVNKKGYRALAKVSDMLKAEIIKDKKAELMIKDLKDQLAKTPTLQGLAAALKDSVKMAPAVNFASYQFGAAGMEPAVIGKAVNAQLNTVSAPIKGNGGVYVVLPSNKKDNTQPYDAKMEKMQLTGRLTYSLPYLIMPALREKANIVDKRYNFF